MKRITLRAVAAIAAVGLTLIAVPARAHHSFEAEYDANKLTSISGVVTKLDWINPHAYVYIDTKDTSGTVKNFRVEMGPPYALVRGGWKRDTIKIGDKVTVDNAALAKDGSNSAGSLPATSMTLSTGQKMVMR